MRGKASFAVFVGIMIVMLVVTSWVPGFAQTKEPIKVGVIATMNWPVGVSAVQALQLAVNKINNEGGLLGRPLKLIVGDSKGQVPNAVAEYQKLVMTERVSVIVLTEGGNLTLACQKAGAELYKEFPHIMMNAGASALDIPKNVRDNYNSYKFGFTLYTTAPDRFLFGAMILTYLTEHQMKPKPKKVAILGEDILDYNPYWQGWPEYGFRPYADVLYKDRGIDVVYTTKIAVGEKMFLPMFEKIAASGAEFIDFTMGAYSDQYVLAKQWASSAARDIPFWHSGNSPKYCEISGGACLGMLGWWPSDFVDYEVVGKTREYTQTFYKTYGYPGSNWMAEGAYDDLLFWAEGVKRTKTMDTENLIKTMENIEVDCTRGRLRVNPIDHASHNYPYKKGFVEEVVKTIATSPIAEVTGRLKKLDEKYGFFPYLVYPYGPVAPVSQWQNDGKITILYPPEVAHATNPGQGYIPVKDLRARQK